MDATTPNPSRPYWIPDGIAFQAPPQALQLATTEIVNPVYQELILEAGDALERSAAATLVHLLWLEFLQQVELGNHLDNLVRPNHGFAVRADMIARHSRVVGAKQHTGTFLLRLKAFHEKSAAGLSRPAAPPT